MGEIIKNVPEGHNQYKNSIKKRLTTALIGGIVTAILILIIVFISVYYVFFTKSRNNMINDMLAY